MLFNGKTDGKCHAFYVIVRQGLIPELLAVERNRPPITLAHRPLKRHVARLPALDTDYRVGCRGLILLVRVNVVCQRLGNRSKRVGVLDRVFKRCSAVHCDCPLVVYFHFAIQGHLGVLPLLLKRRLFDLKRAVKCCGFILYIEWRVPGRQCNGQFTAVRSGLPARIRINHSGKALGHVFKRVTALYRVCKVRAVELDRPGIVLFRCTV